MIHEHLTSEQMEALLSDPELKNPGLTNRSHHLRLCQACSSEFESLKRVMGDLRVAAIGAAEEHRRVAVMPVLSHRTPRPMWGLLAAAALICIGGPLAVRHRPTAVSATNVVQQQTPVVVSDEQLMSNVQDDLSSAVPKPMLPLAASVPSADQTTSMSSSTY